MFCLSCFKAEHFTQLFQSAFFVSIKIGKNQRFCVLFYRRFIVSFLIYRPYMRSYADYKAYLLDQRDALFYPNIHSRRFFTKICQLNKDKKIPYH